MEIACSVFEDQPDKLKEYSWLSDLSACQSFGNAFYDILNTNFFRNKDGGNLVRLTSLGKDGSVGSPRWAPDGESIAFDYLAEGDTGADILVVSASGGPPRRVTTAPSPDVRPSWTRDGRWIYLSHRTVDGAHYGVDRQSLGDE